jgi:diaminopimelate decarboxylase
VAPEPVVAAVRRAARPVCAYVYHRAALREAAARLRAALPPGTTLLYAMKANSDPAVVRTLAGCTDGLEVASGGELSLAVPALSAARRARPGRIVFGGPAKTDAELAAALAAGALVNAESAHELRRLALLAPGTGAPVPVALRVNRAATGPAGTHRMAGQPTPFGIEESRLGEAVALADELPGIRPVGFGLHAVSNNLDAAGHADFVVAAVRWARAAAARHGVALEYVNAGGGLGVDYLGRASFDLGALRAGLSRLSAADAALLVVEPGRYLAAGAGWYAAEVLDLKRTHGRWFAVLRGGTHHFRLPAAWGYSHPFEVLPVDGWPYPFARPEVRDVEVDAVGELCTPRDVLARGQRVARLRVGDVLLFGRAGAYGWDISHHDFLRHPYPQTFVV